MPEEQVPQAQPAAQPPAKASDENLMAAISYLWIVSIIILLTKKGSDYIQFHAKQATVLFVIWVVLWAISIPLWFLAPIFWVVDVILLIAAIVGFIKAYSGERFRMPLIADLADKIKI